jgi:hypothetical protein
MLDAALVSSLVTFFVSFIPETVTVNCRHHLKSRDSVKRVFTRDDGKEQAAKSALGVTIEHLTVVSIQIHSYAVF